MKPKKAIVASSLALLILMNDVILSHSMEMSLWRERGIARGVGAVKIPPARLTNTALKGEEEITEILNKLPSDMGTVQKTNISLNPDKPTVIHIQDIHMNLEAQKNVKNIIDVLVHKGNVKLIGLEGAFGKIDLEDYKELKEETRKQVADSFLEKLDIGGPLYFGLTQPGDAKLIGVDDPKLFKKNWAAVKNVSGSAEALRGVLEERSRKIEGKKKEELNKDLKKFDAMVESYRKNLIPLKKYITTLHEEYQINKPNIVYFKEAVKLEERLKMETINRKRDEFIGEVLRKLTEEERYGLVELAQRQKQSNVSGSVFFEELFKLAKKEGIKTIPKELTDYVNYTKVNEKMDIEGLMKELYESEQEIYKKLSKTEEEKELIERGERIYFTEKLANFSLTPEDWRNYRELSKKGNEIGQFKESFESFYELAKKRDEAIAKNVREAVRKEEKKIIILVTGGFHSEGIQEELKKAGMNVIKVSPYVNLVEAVSGTKSLMEVAGKKWMMDDLFVEGNTYLTQPVLTAGLERDITHAALLREAGTGVGGRFQETAVKLLKRVRQVLVASFTLKGRRYLLLGSANGAVDLVSSQQGDVNTRSIMNWPISEVLFYFLRPVVFSWSMMAEMIRLNFIAKQGVSSVSAAEEEETAIHLGQLSRWEWLKRHEVQGLPWLTLVMLVIVINIVKLAIRIIYLNSSHYKNPSLKSAIFIHSSYNKFWEYILVPLEIHSKTFVSFFLYPFFKKLIHFKWFVPANLITDPKIIDLAMRDMRHEDKLPAEEGGETHLSALRFMENHRFVLDKHLKPEKFPDFLEFYPYGQINSNIYFGVRNDFRPSNFPDLWEAAIREYATNNSLRVNWRVRQRALHPYHREVNPDDPNDFLVFEAKVLVGTSRYKPAFFVKRNKGWKVLNGIFEPDDVLVDPTNQEHVHTYGQFIKAQDEFQFVPVMMDEYERLAWKGPDGLRFSVDSNVRGRLVTRDEYEYLTSVDNNFILDPHGQYLIYANTVFRHIQHVVVMEAKYSRGIVPKSLIEMRQFCRFFLGATSKYNDLLSLLVPVFAPHIQFDKTDLFKFDPNNAYDLVVKKEPWRLPKVRVGDRRPPPYKIGNWEDVMGDPDDEIKPDTSEVKKIKFELNRILFPGMHKYWLKWLERYPEKKPFIAAMAGLIEGLIPFGILVAALLGGASSAIIIGLMLVWVGVNGWFKYFKGFVTFTDKGPEGRTGKQDFQGWVLSNITSWTSLIFLGLLFTDNLYIKILWVVVGLSLHAVINFIIATVLNSLPKSLSQVNTSAAVIVTVADETFKTDLKRLEKISHKMNGDNSPENNFKGVIVSYVGNKPHHLAQLKLAAPDALFVKGLRPKTHGIYDVADILKMAQVQLSELPSKKNLETVIDQLVNPLSKEGNFVFVSSNLELFDIPIYLQGRVWILSRIMGMIWTINPYQTIVDRVTRARVSLIAA
ncbi:MAG: hypothetical protein ACKVQC_11050, partial [Elusimicrobiota bacterium]